MNSRKISRLAEKPASVGIVSCEAGLPCTIAARRSKVCSTSSRDKTRPGWSGTPAIAAIARADASAVKSAEPATTEFRMRNSSSSTVMMAFSSSATVGGACRKPAPPRLLKPIDRIIVAPASLARLLVTMVCCAPTCSVVTAISSGMTGGCSGSANWFLSLKKIHHWGRPHQNRSTSWSKAAAAISKSPMIFCQSLPRCVSRYSKNDEVGSFNSTATA